VRKVVRRTTTLENFPRQCLQWFLKIDQSECSKSPIDLLSPSFLSPPRPSFLSIHFIPISLPPPPHCLSPSFLSILPYSSPSTSSLSLSLLLLTSSLPPSSQSSSSLPLSFLPLNPPPCFLSFIPIHPPHYLSPSFLSVILLITSLPPSFQSSSPPLHPSFLSIHHLITSLLFPVILSSTSLPLSFFCLHPPY
jgi:hypothetical protein